MKQKALLLSRLVWHGKHELIHISIGILWFTIIRSSMDSLPKWYVLIAIFASLLPDMEHVYYWFVSKQKHSDYSKTIKTLMKEKKFLHLWKYVEGNHKTQSFLHFHHLGVVLVFFIATIWSLQKEHEFLSLLYGSVMLHYCFDIVDDILYLKRLNPNWTKGIRTSRNTVLDNME